MANMSLSTEISLPYLRQALIDNESSYQYLKNILQDRRDREQRQDLQGQKTKSANILSAMASSTSIQAVTCIAIVGEQGFFDLDGLSLRLVCKQLKLIHLDIIHRLPYNIG